MRAKEVRFATEAREKMLHGLDTLANAVKRPESGLRARSIVHAAHPGRRDMRWKAGAAKAMDGDIHNRLGGHGPSMMDWAVLGFSFLMIAWIILAR